MSLHHSMHTSSQGQQRSMEFCWQLAHQSRYEWWSVQISSITKIQNVSPPATPCSIKTKYNAVSTHHPLTNVCD